VRLDEFVDFILDGTGWGSHHDLDGLSFTTTF